MDTISDFKDAESKKFYKLEGSDVTLFIVTIDSRGMSFNVYVEGQFLGMVDMEGVNYNKLTVHPTFHSGSYAGVESLQEAVTILKLKNTGSDVMSVEGIRNIVNRMKNSYDPSYR